MAIAAAGRRGVVLTVGRVPNSALLSLSSSKREEEASLEGGRGGGVGKEVDGLLMRANREEDDVDGAGGAAGGAELAGVSAALVADGPSG